MFNYSIIIPYRDTYNLLLKAVSSIPERSDIQILIVDNSNVPLSKDKIPVRISSVLTYLISSPLKGAGCARNTGLKQARGKYVLFLDADDYFAENAFEHFDKYLSACYDITYFKATSIKLNSNLPSVRHLNICRQIDLFLESGIEDYIRLRIENPICKLFLKSFLDSNNFCFDEVRCSNDTMFSIKTGFYAKTIAASSDVVYVITEGESGSTLTSSKSRENQYIRFCVSLRRNKFLEEVGKKKYRIRIFPSIFHAFSNWGPSEGFRYLSLALKSGSNILAGYLGI